MADDRRRKPCLVGVDQRIKGYGGGGGPLAGGASIAGGAGAGPLAKCESDVGCSAGSPLSETAIYQEKAHAQRLVKMNHLTHANPIAPLADALSQQKAYAGNLLHAIICTSLKESEAFGRDYLHPEHLIKVAGNALNFTNGTAIVNFILEEQSIVQLINY